MEDNSAQTIDEMVDALDRALSAFGEVVITEEKQKVIEHNLEMNKKLGKDPFYYLIESESDEEENVEKLQISNETCKTTVLRILDNAITDLSRLNPQKKKQLRQDSKQFLSTKTMIQYDWGKVQNKTKAALVLNAALISANERFNFGGRNGANITTEEITGAIGCGKHTLQENFDICDQLIYVFDKWRRG